MFAKLKAVWRAFRLIRCRRCHRPLRTAIDRAEGIGRACKKKETDDPLA